MTIIDANGITNSADTLEHPEQAPVAGKRKDQKPGGGGVPDFPGLVQELQIHHQIRIVLPSGTRILNKMTRIHLFLP